MKSNNGSLLQTDNQIQAEIEKTYKAQLQLQNPYSVAEASSILRNINQVNLDCYKLEQPLHENEILMTQKRMKKNKAPGADGIPVEFYLHMWKHIKNEFTEMANATLLQHCGVSKSQGSSCVRLIPKQAKPTSLSDYRPIVLLCTDYKILAATINQRIRPNLPITIGEGQKGAIPAALFALDLSKAFDLVNRDFLWDVLQKMGYPSTFISMIKSLYAFSLQTFSLGQITTRSIEAPISIRQGCPMSSTLFVIYIEPPLRNITNNIKGINCLGTSLRITTYLDDVNIFAGSKADVQATRREISDYCKMMGAKLNTNKTTVRYTSAWNKERFCEWAQEADNQKIVGITFFQTIEETIKQNWANAERSFYEARAANKYRSLNFYQRAKLIREKFVSKSIHLAQILPCPNLTASNI